MIGLQRAQGWVEDELERASRRLMLINRKADATPRVPKIPVAVVLHPFWVGLNQHQFMRDFLKILTFKLQPPKRHISRNSEVNSWFRSTGPRLKVASN